jgi:acyl-CoA reductase-like NAD-dependent aldehyde dehydrogenase
MNDQSDEKDELVTHAMREVGAQVIETTDADPEELAEIIYRAMRKAQRFGTESFPPRLKWTRTWTDIN